LETKSDLLDLQARFGIAFRNPSLLEQAMTHTSFAYENHVESNQRLEFLGDAVLGLAVARFMYDRVDADEGVLTKRRAKIICETSLARFARDIRLGDYLRLGRGEEKANGRERQSNLADAFEALLGAAYLDRGMTSVRHILERTLFPAILDENDETWNTDYKSTLQELMQAEKRTLEYVVKSETGPSNARTFEVCVRQGDENIVLGEGRGTSKKAAEQEAAKDALEKLAVVRPEQPKR
jgi:ribonuclease-3